MAERRLLPRARRPDYHPADGPDAGLDDLLRFEEEPPDERRLATPQAWVGRAAMHSILASIVVYAALRLANLDPPYLLILAICVGVVLVRRAVVMMGEPFWHRTSDVMRPVRPVRRAEPGGWNHDGDGMLDAVRRWDRRLEWGATAPERFGVTVGTRLAELADERIRQHHGFTRAQDPQRARSLLGEAAWAMIYEPTDRIPSPREVAAVIGRLESL